jgi:hypothetical protein
LKRKKAASNLTIQRDHSTKKHIQPKQHTQKCNYAVGVVFDASSTAFHFQIFRFKCWPKPVSCHEISFCEERFFDHREKRHHLNLNQLQTTKGGISMT